jgi:RNA polymerase sigma factor for flagellar operon FliA
MNGLMKKNRAIYEYSENKVKRELSSIVDENIHLVHQAVASICKKLPSHIEHDDMFQVGSIGLLKAAKSYTGANGAKFSTYAYYKIRGAIYDEVRSSDWKPRRAQKRTKDIAIAINTLEKRGFISPADTKIAEELNISMEEYNTWIRETSTSKIIPMIDDKGDYYDANTPDNTYANIESADLQRLIKEALEKLPTESAQIVSLHYMEELSFKDIGFVMGGISPAKCSRIFKKSLITIKAHLINNEVGIG